jgi:hypothetical protein
VLFETAFVKGTTEKVNNATITLNGITIGKLRITDGHIIACDPLHIDEYGKPFTQLFPTGEFPVQLSIAKLDHDERVAYARIKFSDESVAKWEFALLEAQSQLPLGGDERHGYSVDAGVAIFIDQAAARVVNQDSLRRMDAGMFREMDNHFHGGWRYTLHDFGKNNLAAFTTGLGDGYYSTYIGFDANGKPCRLLTDFRIFDWSRSVTPSTPR